jgi:NAD(P)-dependent dehydrogenase (short-subunit alcohol dehydrogenase family)
MTEIAGKVALVTGGGSGIGRGLVMALAAEGASVVVADILSDTAEKVAGEVAEAGGSAVAVACDVSDRASVRDLKAAANEAFGTVSLLFANAGATAFEPLTDMSDDDVDWILQVNLMGVTYCLQTFLPDMIRAGDGHVIATASTAGLFQSWVPNHVPYSAAKAGIIAMMLNVRRELAGTGVGSTAYCPGGVQSGMRENNGRYRPMRFGGPTDGEVPIDDDWVEQNEMRFLPPEEVAPIVLRAVRSNAPIVLDHSYQRPFFYEHYVNYVIAAFDEIEALEREMARQ